VASFALPAVADERSTEQQQGFDAARKAIAALRVPEGFRVEVFAAHPQLASPVAICLDEGGRVFVAEEHRFNRGTEENRTRPFLLEDDLQIRTVDDRLAIYKKWAHKFPGGMAWFSKHSDRLRLLEDRDGDGRADRSTVFAAGFNHPLDGLAAGVLARDGDVYFTCIPNLWLLRDTNGDGRADFRKKLHRGFGVNAAFLGHDLHGLVWGPDGKLYFSVGDRGFHVTTHEGETLSAPRRGAVFRCLPDGSELEVVALGLRNPQELAFDKYGNLFAADNNCDKGDHSRLVYVLEGGDSGWNMAYQTIPEPYLTGPWHAEKMWHLPHPEQPAWILPPIGKLGAGPSGFAFDPGTGVPPSYRDHFFLCNYTGNGGLETFALDPKGAAFRVVGYRDFLKPIRATDAEFGYDGKIYVSDFVNLDWSGRSLGGRIYTLFDPEQIGTPAVKQMQRLFAEGFKQRNNTELVKLLAHADMRVRLRAQFTLAERWQDEAVAEAFRRVAHDQTAGLARLHAVWGLGQIARHRRSVLGHLEPLLSAEALQVRLQAIKVLGDHRWQQVAGQIVGLLADEDPRVRLFAAMALGKLHHKPAAGPIFAMLEANGDRDPFLRHAGVMALVWIGDFQAVQARAKHASAAVRMAALLVQRRSEDPRIVQFFDDADVRLVTEAARAVNDVPIDAGMPKLAAQIERVIAATEPLPDAFVRRAINANFRRGGAKQAADVARLAANENLSPAMRQEALAALEHWSNPSPRDRVTGKWRPLAKRDEKLARAALQAELPQLLASTEGDLQARVVESIGRMGLEADEATFLEWVADARRAPRSRIAALNLLSTRKSPQLEQAIEQGLRSSSPRLRAAARRVLTQVDAERGLEILQRVLANPKAATLEKQQAFPLLAKLDGLVAESALETWAERLIAGKVPPELQLDLLEALDDRPSSVRYAETFRAKLEDDGELGRFRLALLGGDSSAGRDIFVGHRRAQCIRCHKIKGRGGNAGPDLSQVAKRGDRKYLLQSIIDPNAKIAKGYGSVVLALSDGRVVAGTIKTESPEQVSLETPDGKLLTIPQGEIEDRTKPKSEMPAMQKHLSLRQLRDLVEYLSLQEKK